VRVLETLEINETTSVPDSAARAAGGVVLYDGEASGVSFGERLFAVSIRALWDRQRAQNPQRNSRRDRS
jgi:hypothetical protein